MNDADAIVFDLYGTLLDVGSLAEKVREVTSAPLRLLEIWRQKQLQYTWLRSVMGEHRDFWKVTIDALDYAIEKCQLDVDIPTRGRMLDAWLSLTPYPETTQALARMAPRRLGVLSNGTPEMLAAGIASAGLDKVLSPVLSVEAAGVFKPHPSVYALVPEALGFPKERILFVSSNAWDAAGAKTFGFPVAWVKRGYDPFEALDATPDLVVADLGELADALDGN